MVATKERKFEWDIYEKAIASYGSLVRFKGYGDMYLVESIYLNPYNSEEVSIRFIPNGDYDQSRTKVQFLNGVNLPNRVRSGAIGITVHKNEIEIISFNKAFKAGYIVYNDLIPLRSNVVCIEGDDNENNVFRKAIGLSKTLHTNILIPICTNKDQRFYLPVCENDYMFDVIIRKIVYSYYLPFQN